MAEENAAVPGNLAMPRDGSMALPCHAGMAVSKSSSARIAAAAAIACAWPRCIHKGPTPSIPLRSRRVV
ncbi:hypothetical protein [Amycolatopsis lurida]|uniref:hypothetical protein n=1 Tax=Amycolatopsis lurida TaxID=31959 RepID=UPI001F5263FC|nr:hypothetical protein [Amycolatopsis lurida]